ncbi:response regulator [Maricaulis parjimensis]|uniref:response regulator n=1 Tax=Maricaulis parjimensis TaxID=144023 RepID=UPI001939BAEC|nr:response regulator [Maricaulis parjimensis]
MSDRQTVTVILVDDDPDEHFLFRADLEDSGVHFEFEAFTRPEDALDWLRASPGKPVLILSDLSLAGHDAVDFIAASGPLMGEGAVGVYSGTRNPEVEAKCREAGASFYIVKPVTRSVFEKTIAEVEAFDLEDRDGGLYLVLAKSGAA